MFYIYIIFDFAMAVIMLLLEYGFIGQKDKHPNSCLVII